MPTGYTADVVDGKITEFRDFALQCARAFGALIEMRDEPHDAPIPDEFKPSPYHTEQLAAAKEELRALEALTPEDAEKRAAKSYADARRSWEERQKQLSIENDRLNAMLLQVRLWSPPTPDHFGMQKFMIEQLTVSLNTLGLYAPKKADAAEWLKKALQSARWNVEYHEKELKAEQERAASRTAWIQALKASLAPKPSRNP